MDHQSKKRGRPRKHYESIDDMCEYLSVSRATLYRMMDRGLPWIYVGSYRRFDRKAVDAWLAERDQRIKSGLETGVAWLEETGLA